MELPALKLPAIELPFDIPVLLHPPVDHFAGKEAFDALTQAGQAELKAHKLLGTYLVLASAVVVVFKLLSAMIQRGMMKALFLLVLIVFVGGILKQGKDGGELVYKYGANVERVQDLDSELFDAKEELDEIKEKVKSASKKVSEKVETAEKAVAEAAKSAVEKTSEAVESAKESVSETAKTVEEKSTEVLHEVKEKADELKENAAAPSEPQKAVEEKTEETEPNSVPVQPHAEESAAESAPQPTVESEEASH